MSCNKLGDFSSAVAVKYSEETDVIIAWDGVVGYIGILHVPPPTLHLADCVFVVAIFIPCLFFGCNWFVQKTISHINISLPLTQQIQMQLKKKLIFFYGKAQL